MKTSLRKKYNTVNKLINSYNRMVDSFDLSNKSSEIIRQMTTEQLFVFIAAKTVCFGRSLECSFDNAEAHIRSGVESIVKSFCTIDKEKINGAI